ncbi:MAG: hypothetical protein ACQES2_04925 [Pseudomonadota bacterium]
MSNTEDDKIKIFAGECIRQCIQQKKTRMAAVREATSQIAKKFDIPLAKAELTAWRELAEADAKRCNSREWIDIDLSTSRLLVIQTPQGAAVIPLTDIFKHRSPVGVGTIFPAPDRLQ